MNDEQDEFDFSIPESEPVHQTYSSPMRRVSKIAKTKHETALMQRGDDLSSWLGKGLPGTDETWHVISDGTFDLWSWSKWFIDQLGSADALYISTWIISRAIAKDIVRHLDTGTIAHFHLVTGLYFKTRAADVYSYIVGEIQKRGMTYHAFKNHAKVMLIANAEKDAWITVQCSANLTHNPRTEQFVVTNNREVFDFHRTWMNEMLHR